jgi:hypothetical protein
MFWYQWDASLKVTGMTNPSPKGRTPSGAV